MAKPSDQTARPTYFIDSIDSAFQAAYGAKFPKAVAKITDDVEQLLAFYDYPAEHWIHLRTTDPIVILSRASIVCLSWWFVSWTCWRMLLVAGQQGPIVI